MSLSHDPARSLLRDHFVAGFQDITHEPWAGTSGHHELDGNAIRTTNGAGPRNMQLMMLTPDGTVVHALPGYWSSEDLAHEMEFAYDMAELWMDPSLPEEVRRQKGREAHLAHIGTHSPAMVRRSRMQGFDMKFEARWRLDSSDTILDPELAARTLQPGAGGGQGFKTTDRIAHERMAARVFLPYEEFDVARYVDYGRPRYEKNEDHRDERGRPTEEFRAKIAEKQALRQARMERRAARMGRAGSAGRRAGSAGRRAGSGGSWFTEEP